MSVAHLRTVKECEDKAPSYPASHSKKTFIGEQ